jgi:hypothetical protein
MNNHSTLIAKVPISWVAAMLVLPGSVLAQALSLTETPTDETQYLAFIEQEQDDAGLTSPELIEPLTALAQQYYARQDYELAAEAFARARQILRVNDGFDTVAELPLLVQLVRTEEARGNPVEAWELEQTLLALAQQHVGEIETFPIFRDVADKRLALRRRYLQGDRFPELELGCYYGKDAQITAMVRRGERFNVTEKRVGNCSAGERDTVNVALLLEARSYQVLALEALLQSERYASPEFWEALLEILRTSDSIQRRLPLFNDAELGGLLARLLSYEAADSASRIRRAHVLIQLADMNVARTRQADRYVGYDAVLEQYAQAYAALVNEGVSAAELEAIFAPAVPVVVPTFFDNSLTMTTAETEASDYIDVAFEITRQGKSRRMEVLATSANVERAHRRELAQLIDQSSFRPRMVDGRIADSARVVMRYYLSPELD